MSVPQTFAALLAEAAARHPAHSGITGDHDAPWSYAAIAAEAGRFAAGLRHRGIGRDDRLGLVLRQDAGSTVALIAAMSACAAVPLPPLGTAELDAALPRLGLRALLVPAGLDDPARAAAARFGIPVIERTQGAGGDMVLSGEPAGPPLPDRQARPDDIAVIVLTSGSTGRAKLVPRTHRNVVDSAFSSHRQQPLGPGDRSILFTPISHSYAHEQIARSIGAAARLDLRGPFAPQRLPADLAACRPTWLALTPFMLDAWLRLVDSAGHEPPSGIRFIQVSSAHLPDSLKSAAAAAFGTPILNSYGSSEALTIAYEAIDGDCGPGAAGELTAEVRIVDPYGASLPPGVPGGIEARGDTVFPGYLDDPAANARVFTPDGWFRTGDRGILSPGGCLTVLGRADDVINRGGDKIDPAEVDAILLDHPAVAECATFGLPHPTLGAEVVAAVVLRRGENVPVRELRRWGLDRLSAYKVPRKFFIIDALPRTANGKIRRDALPDIARRG